MSQENNTTVQLPQTREEYVLAQDKAGFQPGQRVRVERAAKSFEAGWDNDWVEDPMDEYVGKEFVISEGFGDCPAEQGIPLVGPSQENLLFPYFVLVPVN